MRSEYSDVYVGFLGLSWQEKVVSHLSKAYPENKNNWKKTFERVYDAYVPLVNVGNKHFAGPGDTVTAAKISAITGDTPADVIKTLSAVSSVDNEKITLKHIGILTKIATAPAEALAAALKAALKPFVPYIITAVALGTVGAYLYFIHLPKSQMRAITRQKI
jgi:hypothetical protein